MNRRQFLSFASVPIAAAVVVPELVRTIILPPRGGWPVDWSRYLTSKDAWFKDLERFWREAYDKGVLCDDGKRYKLAEDWTALYGSSGA